MLANATVSFLLIKPNRIPASAANQSSVHTLCATVQ
jgi:hypothetical protein